MSGWKPGERDYGLMANTQAQGYAGHNIDALRYASLHTYDRSRIGDPKNFRIEVNEIRASVQVHDPVSGLVTEFNEADVMEAANKARLRPAEMVRGMASRAFASDMTVSRAEYNRVVDELTALKRRFESLFGIPADKVSPAKFEQNPDHPEQWRVRIHVEAFDVETTIGTLAAAQREPAKAGVWFERAWTELPDVESVMRAKATLQQQMVEHVLSSRNIESIQTIYDPSLNSQAARRAARASVPAVPASATPVVPPGTTPTSE